MTYFIDPSRAHFDVFKSLPRDTPIHMLNLLRFKARADYPKGHEHAGKGWTGRQAYAEYGRVSAPIMAKVGGHIAWRGDFEAMVIGPDDKPWEHCFIAAYPDANAFLAMVTDPEYQAGVPNRVAALIDSRLMRFAPKPGGEGFGAL